MLRTANEIKCDSGWTLLRLTRFARARKPPPKIVPSPLLKHWPAGGNREQDFLIGDFRAGMTGSDLLAKAREKAIKEGLEPTICRHAIGFHGHGTGP